MNEMNLTCIINDIDGVAVHTIIRLIADHWRGIPKRLIARLVERLERHAVDDDDRAIVGRRGECGLITLAADRDGWRDGVNVDLSTAAAEGA